MLHTGLDLLTPRQKTRLEALFAGDDHVEVETTWGIYQKMIAAYREPDKAKGKTLMQAVITAIGSGVEEGTSVAGGDEVGGDTLTDRSLAERADVLAA